MMIQSSRHISYAHRIESQMARLCFDTLLCLPSCETGISPTYVHATGSILRWDRSLLMSTLLMLQIRNLGGKLGRCIAEEFQAATVHELT